MKNTSQDLFAFATNERFWRIVMRNSYPEGKDREIEDFLLWFFAGDALRKRLSAIFGKTGTTTMAANAILTSAHSIRMGDDEAACIVGRWISESILSGDAGIFRELSKAVGSNKKQGNHGMREGREITLPDPNPTGNTLAAVMFDELVSFALVGPLPTKAELDLATVKATGSGGCPEPKDLREARKQLGLRGLPKATGGRPKGG